MKQELTAERLRQLLDYNPETGEFTWKFCPTNFSRIGKIAGCLNTLGYWQIGLLGGRYYGHRLAWLHFHGVWPPDEVDHVDGNPSNNKMSNLRLTNRSVNMQNRTKINTKAKSGLIGAYLSSNGRYQSKIMLNGKGIYLGAFDTAEEAHEAYVRGKREMHEGNTL